MDVLLIGIAALALILAIGMGLILFKVLNDERQRSDARVAALAAAASTIDLPLSSQAADLTLPDHVVSRSDLFTAADEASPWPRRAAVAAALAVAVGIGGYAIAAWSGRALPAAVPAAPLELLSLKHTQESGTLTVSGSVRNPRTGVPQAQVFATAVLFGPDGNFLTSGRAALDFTSLAPGDESPFVIAVPVNGTVARYRVGFRAPDGSVIAHVDRRADSTAAGQHSQVPRSTSWPH
jgi:hypothetical protein